MVRAFMLLVALVFTQGLAMAAEPSLNLLFLGDQGSHQPATRFAILKPVMAQRGIALTYTERVEDLNLAKLNQYDGLILYANIDTIEPDQAQALLTYVASGKGFIPIHCATYCFRNSPQVVALMGAQFKSHGTGEMTTQSAGIKHPIVEGYQTFTSWDETYVHHLHNESNRVVLEYRVGDLQADGNQREPWTWIRTHGAGRVFYTAWGHDQRTWSQPSFHDLLERGIRWACGEGDADMAEASGGGVGSALPKMKSLPENLKPFEYVDVGPKIPNYPADKIWGRQKEPLSLMQKPVPSAESLQHMVTPEGLHVEVFADESMLQGTMLQGKPIAMSWDELGRLWICETLDYPNELSDSGQGRDRVRVLEDTDGDQRADKSTIFAENLSIPTSIAFHRGGIVVQNGIETLYLKDTDGDGRADLRKVLISNWALGDTHGGVSNFRNGLDNWIWAMQGYNNSSPILNPETPATDSPLGSLQTPAFRMGFFRFKLSQADDPMVEKLEFVRSTTNNTWGIGISEEGLIFGSTANRQPSFFMPIANRYYERVKGWAPETLDMICSTHLFAPITDKVRQVDHHGGYTAAAGHALYTARSFPKAYWNRTAFVCGPTGKLVGTFVIERQGAGMKSESPGNLLASNDEWTAPIMAEVGPDGNVWVLDWYNYIVQHNPTPHGFETGKGKAYESDLRDKKYGRIYRVVADTPVERSQPLASGHATAELIAALKSPTMLVRLQAQRLLVERGQTDIVPELLKLLADQSTDEIGMNGAAIHALHTLQGLGLLETDSGDVFAAVVKSLAHPSAGVRRNAIQVLPDTQKTLTALQDAKLLSDSDAQVLLAALLKCSDLAQADAGEALAEAIAQQNIDTDRWLMDAMTSAAAMHAERFLVSVLHKNEALSEAAQNSVTRVAEHLARSRPSAETTSALLQALASNQHATKDAVVAGLALGWPADHRIVLEGSEDATLKKLFASVSRSSKASLARLASTWSNHSLDAEVQPIIEAFVSRVSDTKLSVKERLQSAQELVQFDPGRDASIDALLKWVGPQSPVELSVGLVDTSAKARIDGLADRYVQIIQNATPDIRQAVLRAMLSRGDLATALMRSLEKGTIHVSELSVEQQSRLMSNPDLDIRRAYRDLLQAGGIVINNDRTKLVEAKLPLAEQQGDSERGKTIFTKNCATCHVFKGEGNIVGPNLNGMSVHPKAELLIHILDPNRSVEANYRLYTVLTADGAVVSGLLSSESLTSIEVVDAQGKRHTILREDIDQLNASKNSAMPEGFEQSIKDDELVDLLEYLTDNDSFVPLGLESVANVVTTEGMFTNRGNRRERLVLDGYGPKVVEGVPFVLIDPAGTSVKNAIMLHGTNGPFAPQMPKSVSIRCKMAATKIHILGGVAGWAPQSPSNDGESLIVRLHYAGGNTEDHPLVSGQHIADYIDRFDVPQSSFALPASDGGQVRYLAIQPQRNEMIDTIELVKPDHQSAPLVLAITAEVAAKKKSGQQ